MHTCTLWLLIRAKTHVENIERITISDIINVSDRYKEILEKRFTFSFRKRNIADNWG